MGWRMSRKSHVLHCHLNVFKGKMTDYSEEQGDRFHQDFKDFERRYQGQKCSKRVMSDYVWHLVRESDVRVHKRETRSEKAVRFVEKSDSSPGK